MPEDLRNALEVLAALYVLLMGMFILLRTGIFDERELSDLGWSLDKTILGRQHLDLCPDCTKEIAQFLFREDK